ncbi:MAG: hypothetical protein ACPKPY_07300 [Nitrososphaeraceae archaeon]
MFYTLQQRGFNSTEKFSVLMINRILKMAIIAIPMLMMTTHTIGILNHAYAQANFPQQQQMNNPVPPQMENPFAKFWTEQETFEVQESLQNTLNFDRFIQVCGLAMQYNSTYGQPCSDTIKDISLKFNEAYNANKDFIDKVLRNN